MSADDLPIFRDGPDGFRWAGVELMKYKEDGSAPFKAISRQVLFSDPNLASELRYFEIEPGGFSTLERHEHVHAVMILRGRGTCFVGEKVRAVGIRDLVAIAPWTWHQFRATAGEALGFLCLVNTQRDRPQLPNAEDLASLRAIPGVAEFLDGK
jgi:quercetin dioxygenase-like cupin family protein